ncbi:hypothetical protein L8P11_02705 [Enterobacter kobei]|uniref:hypothetical protein n=1 Tax=Enterobacter TaxID=547 RepID=UPI000C1ED02D|nr:MULTISPECIES: hypothetical protein [Enterobacter]MCK7222189.1 hypothetical protein [Enterobacter kobei]PJD08661.1 hypothetical protein B9Q20_06855 [Enterobacter mori]HEG2084531.1 hypothetical protein [Enterobacter kobei]
MLVKPVLIDTNLLLLYLVGLFSEEAISQSKRLSSYSINDFRLLQKFLDGLPKILITSNIATEISNLIDFNGESLKRFYAIFDAFLQLPQVEEVHLESKLISSRIDFSIYGLTDAGINSLAKKFLILTDDSRLYSYYCGNICTSSDPNNEIINFYHIIQATW